MIALEKLREATEIHTRMLRLGLGAEDSRAYWENANRQLSEAERAKVAFEERWFGSRTMARVRYLVSNFIHRYDTYPRALQVLHRWNPVDPRERNVLCHWHVQLSDPLYREFTGSILPGRRLHPEPTIDRTTTLRFVDRKVEGRWASSTSQRMAAGLLACACEAGLCEGSSAVRPLRLPRVSDLALGYLLQLLREVEFEGSLRENPYLSSVGIDSVEWEQRLRRMPWVRYARAGNVHDLSFEHASLLEWAEAVL